MRVAMIVLAGVAAVHAATKKSTTDGKPRKGKMSLLLWDVDEECSTSLPDETASVYPMFDGQTTTCTPFPFTWEGQRGARGAFKSFKITCEMMKNEDGDKEPMWFSTLYTDADCQTKSDRELFAAPFSHDVCFGNYYKQAYIGFWFNECMRDLCAGNGSDKCELDDLDSGKAALTSLTGIALAAVVAMM